MRRKLRINNPAPAFAGVPSSSAGRLTVLRKSVSHLIFMNYDLRMRLRRGCYNNRKSKIVNHKSVAPSPFDSAKGPFDSAQGEGSVLLHAERRRGTSEVEARAKSRYAGLTLTEVVIASALLIIAMVPILKGLTSAHLGSVIIERKSRSLILAQAELDEIKARSVYHYSDTFAQTDVPLDGSYLCNVADSAISSNLRKITVSVGYDLNGNNTLEPDEIEVTLATCTAKRWDS